MNTLPKRTPETATTPSPDPSPSSRLRAEIREKLVKSLADMRLASDLIDNAQDGTAYQLGLISIALIARQFLRDCPNIVDLLDALDQQVAHLTAELAIDREALEAQLAALTREQETQ